MGEQTYLNNTQPLTGDIETDFVLSFSPVDIESTDVSGTITSYVGKQRTDGSYLIVKNVSDDANPRTTTIGYATIINNPLVLTYTAAFAARTTLTYGKPEDIK